MSVGGVSVGGYTCQRCGYWVPNGTVHSCSTSVRTPMVVPSPTPSSDERQAAALERIAVALERIAASTASTETEASE